MGLVDYFGGTEQQPGAPPRRMRLVTFVVSEFGSFGEQAAALVRALASRVGRSVPSSLIDESSWATPSFAPFLRSAIAFEVRRRTAVLLRDGVTSDEAFELRSAWDIAQMARAAADAADDAACTSPAAAPAVAPATAFPVLPLVYAAAVSPTPTDAPSLTNPTCLPAAACRGAAARATAPRLAAARPRLRSRCSHLLLPLLTSGPRVLRRARS